MARGFPGPRLGIALLAVVLATASAITLYPRVIDNPEKRARYENLLHPSRDVSVQERLRKWRQVIADLRGRPFGFGLGTAHPGGNGERLVRLGSDEIDSSYFKIAYEQGIAIALFFLVALIVLLVELLRHAVWSRAPGISAMTTAAAGTLVSMMVEFVSGIYVDSLAVVAGWMIVGLGVAQYARDRYRSDQRPLEPYTYP
jgi:cell division protein FtsW (lipid II flippase)